MDLARLYADAQERVIDLVSPLSPPTLASPVPGTPRWTVEELVAHSGSATTLREVRFVLFGADAEAAFRAEANRQLVAGKQSRDEDRGEEGQRNGR